MFVVMSRRCTRLRYDQFLLSNIISFLIQIVSLPLMTCFIWRSLYACFSYFDVRIQIFVCRRYTKLKSRINLKSRLLHLDFSLLSPWNPIIYYTPIYQQNCTLFYFIKNTHINIVVFHFLTGQDRTQHTHCILRPTKNIYLYSN